VSNGAPFYGERLPDGRRSLPGERKTYDPKKLWESNHEILNLKVLGLTNENVAEILNVTPATVSNTVNSTLGKDKLAMMRGSRDADTWDAAKEIAEASKECLRFLRDAMGDRYEDVEGNIVQASVNAKITIAKHILNDLSGLKAPTRLDARVLNTHLSLEEIEELREAGRSATRELDGKGVGAE